MVSPMPWLTEWFSHPLMQFSGWYSLTMVSVHQIQIGSHRAVLSTPSPPRWFDMRFLFGRWWWWRSVVWLLVMFVGAVVREGKQPNPNPMEQNKKTKNKTLKTKIKIQPHGSKVRQIWVLPEPTGPVLVRVGTLTLKVRPTHQQM